MQHVIKISEIGGPLTGFELLMKSPLKEKYKFIPLEQKIAAHGFNISLIKSLYLQIRATRPDILHIRGLQSDGFYGVISGKLAGCKKIIVSVHGVYSDIIDMPILKRIIFRYIIEPLTLKMADKVYCVCKYASERKIITKNAKKLYGHIHNAAPDYSKYNKEEIRKQFRSAYDIDKNNIVIATVGRITIDKGCMQMINMVKIFKNNTKIKFIIAGDGPFLEYAKNELKEEIKNQVVIFTGKISPVYPVLFASDIFVFTSLHENLSNAILEACSASLPCIVTNVGGNSEIIKNYKTGILYEAGDTCDLVKKVNQLISSRDLRLELGRRAEAYIIKKFSQEKIFGELDMLYSSML